MLVSFSFPTDTATLAIFDPARLRHRLDDDADWWSVPADEVAEINAGNLLSVSVGTDGHYHAKVSFAAAPAGSQHVTAVLACESGQFFVGPGEVIPSGGCPTTAEFGGGFIAVTPGFYAVQVARPEFAELHIFFQPTAAPAQNSFTTSPRLTPDT